MTFTIRPDLEREVHERVRAGPYRTAEEFINAALERFMLPQFEVTELDELLAAGRKQLADGEVVDSADFVRQLRSWGESRRNGE